jgi:hypothetical protein
METNFVPDEPTIAQLAAPGSFWSPTLMDVRPAVSLEPVAGRSNFPYCDY